MHHVDRVIGIALGVIGGIVIVTLFVFLGTEETIDAPSLDEGGSGARESPGGDVPTIRISGGRPESVERLEAVQGEKVRFKVDADAPVTLAVEGLGITADVPGGGTKTVTFDASREGTFPVLISGTTISVASLEITPG